jgi:hypothetical protein
MNDITAAVINKLSEQKLLDNMLAEGNNTPEQIAEWLGAIQSELDSLRMNNTWKLSINEDFKLLDTKWILKVKKDLQGFEERKKARLVLRGFEAEFGIDYHFTFAPVAKTASLRIFLAIANQLNMDMEQMDVITAFLNATVEEDIYIGIPDFVDLEAELEAYPPDHLFRATHPSKLCFKLQRALYGLPQAPRNWFITLHEFLKSQGYNPLDSEPCIYVKFEKDGYLRTIILVYVDDIIVASMVELEKKRIIAQFRMRFKMKSLGIPKKILGLHVQRDKETISIDQEHYILQLLKEYKMDDSLPARTPGDPSVKLSKPDTSELTEEKAKGFKSRTDRESLISMYRSLVGALMFIACATRYDIMHRVSCLARYLTNATWRHWNAAKHVLRYLKGTISKKLTFHRVKDPRLIALSDSDWAGDLDTRRSQSASLILFCGVIHWVSTIQHITALSSAEAEIYALKTTVRDTIWIRHILSQLFQPQLKPTVIYEDNASAIKIVSNPLISKYNRHMDISYHFIREHTELKTIIVKKIGTADNGADLLTKTHKPAPFEHLLRLTEDPHYPEYLNTLESQHE